MSATPTKAATFGQRLQDRRNLKGLTQQEVADQMGVTKAAYQQWEWDRVLPEAGRIPALADALGLSSSTLGRWLEDSPLLVATSGRHSKTSFMDTVSDLLKRLTGPLTNPPFRPLTVGVR